MKEKLILTIFLCFGIAFLTSYAILANSTEKNISLLLPVEENRDSGLLTADINEAVLDGYFPDKLEIILPGSNVVYAIKDNEENMIQNYKAWYGHVEGKEGSSVVFVQKQGEIRGLIVFETKQFSIYKSTNGKHIVKDLSFATTTENYSKLPEKQLKTIIDDIKQTAEDSKDSLIFDTDATTTIGVLDIIRESYMNDPSYEVGCSSERLLQQALTNQIFSKSGVNAKIKLLGCWVSNPYNSDYYDWLYVIHSAALKHPEIANIRNQLGADLVMVIARTGDDECEYTTGYRNSHIAVVQEYASCSGLYTYQRGIALLLGAGYPTKPGLYDYSRGFINPDNQFKTIVTIGGSAPFIPYFSTPDVTYEGLPIGEDQSSPTPADNVSTMNKTAPIVANYRTPAITNLKPVIIATPDSGIAPVTISFDGSESYSEDSTITITDYEWDFGDGSATIHGSTVDNYYMTPNVYTVTLKITGSNGETKTTTKIVRVYDQDKLRVVVSPGLPSIKAYGRQSIIISAYIHNEAGAVIKDKMNLQFKTDLGTLQNNVDFNLFTGAYTQSLLSGDPGDANISAYIDNEPVGNCVVSFLWPLPPLNARVEYVTNHSLFKGLHTVNLFWERNPNDPYTRMYYRIYRKADSGDYQLVAEVGRDVYSWTENNLVAGPEYYYVITTVDVDGDESEYSTALRVR